MAFGAVAHVVKAAGSCECFDTLAVVRDREGQHAVVKAQGDINRAYFGVSPRISQIEHS